MGKYQSVICEVYNPTSEEVTAGEGTDEAYEVAFGVC